MSSFSDDNNFRPVAGRRKRPMRMRVKKYNVDASNNYIAIDMAGRVESTEYHDQRPRSRPAENDAARSSQTTSNVALLPLMEGSESKSRNVIRNGIETGKHSDEYSMRVAPSLFESSVSDSAEASYPSESSESSVVSESDYSDATSEDVEDEAVTEAASVLAKYGTSETRSAHHRMLLTTLTSSTSTSSPSMSSTIHKSCETPGKDGSESRDRQHHPISARSMGSLPSSEADSRRQCGDTHAIEESGPADCVSDRDRDATTIGASDQKELLAKYQNIYNPPTPEHDDHTIESNYNSGEGEEDAKANSNGGEGEEDTKINWGNIDENDNNSDNENENYNNDYDNVNNNNDDDDNTDKYSRSHGDNHSENGISSKPKFGSSWGKVDYEKGECEESMTGEKENDKGTIGAQSVALDDDGGDVFHDAVSSQPEAQHEGSKASTVKNLIKFYDSFENQNENEDYEHVDSTRENEYKAIKDERFHSQSPSSLICTERREEIVSESVGDTGQSLEDFSVCESIEDTGESAEDVSVCESVEDTGESAEHVSGCESVEDTRESAEDVSVFESVEDTGESTEDLICTERRVEIVRDSVEGASESVEDTCESVEDTDVSTEGTPTPKDTEEMFSVLYGINPPGIGIESPPESSESDSGPSGEFSTEDFSSETEPKSKNWFAPLGSLFQWCRAEPASSSSSSGEEEHSDQEIIDEEKGEMREMTISEQIAEAAAVIARRREREDSEDQGMSLSEQIAEAAAVIARRREREENKEKSREISLSAKIAEAAAVIARRRVREENEEKSEEMSLSAKIAEAAAVVASRREREENLENSEEMSIGAKIAEAAVVIARRREREENERRSEYSQVEEDFTEQYSQLRNEEDHNELHESNVEETVTEASLAKEVALMALAKKKSNSQLQSADYYDKIYNQKAEANTPNNSLEDQIAAAANAVKMKNISTPKTEEYYDKLYQPREDANKSSDILADQIAAAAMAVRMKNGSSPKTEEDYDKLYQPKTKTMAYQKNSPATSRDFYESSDNSTNYEWKEERHSSYSSYSNTLGKQLDYDLEASYSSRHSSRSEPIEKPDIKRWSIGRTMLLLGAILVLIIIGVLVYFLVFHGSRNDRDDSTSNVTDYLSTEPTRSPIKSPSFLPTVKPTIPVDKPITSSGPIRTDRPTFQPSRVPSLPDPTIQPIFPTFNPLPSEIFDSPSQPVANNPPPLHITLPPQTSQAKPSNRPSSIASTSVPTDKMSSPTFSAAYLRQLLISQWPPLQESLRQQFSPQSRAFQWLIASNSKVSYSQERLIQRFAMATFFFSTNGQSWSNNDGWLSEESECTWYQTKSYRDPCNAASRILNLELDGNGISGSLPPELALLSNSLARLDLAKDTNNENGVRNFLQGALPSEIGRLTMLQYMSLSNQQMTGKIPDEVSELSLLTVLDLENNRFQGPLMPTIGELQQLHNIYLGSNKLSGTIPSEFGLMRFLVNLDLSGNHFSSTLPSELGKLSYLQSLSLGNNKITGTIPSFLGLLTNLQGSLSLGDNLLTGTIPTDLGQLSMILTVLDLSSNQLTGSVPTELDRLVKLGNLQLQNNLLTGTVPSSFFKLSHLQFLQLEHNNLTGDVPKSVCDTLVTDKIENRISPTYVLTDCASKVSCECCQYCCSESGCECQFSHTNQDYLCKYGDGLSPGVRMIDLHKKLNY